MDGEAWMSPAKEPVWLGTLFSCEGVRDPDGHDRLDHSAFRQLENCIASTKCLGFSIFQATKS